MHVYLTLFCLLVAFSTSIVSRSVPDSTKQETDDRCKPECDSKIYCQGEILHDIQLSEIFKDDHKDFVDHRLLFSEEKIIEKYEMVKNGTLGLKQFIDENFATDPLESWTPPDFKENPSILLKVDDYYFKNWILELNQIWRKLSVKVSDDVRKNPQKHSLLYLPNGFIKAGGRFKEMYYWDSYWIIRGLLLCDMFDTARGIIENMLHLVGKYGYVPNGSRKYYLGRSQPPLLIQMAATYYHHTNNNTFIEKKLKLFDKEFQFWYSHRMVNVQKDGKMYRMAHYSAPSCNPRPESYKEDFELSKNLTDEEKKKFFTGIRSAAESGWDFSSRHMIVSGELKNGTLLDTQTQNLIYVDLNCMLHANAIKLSEWYEKFGNRGAKIRSKLYKKIADDLLVAIENVLWNEEAGTWLDWDFTNNKSRNYFYISNLTPLWTGSYSKNVDYAERTLDYLQKMKIIEANLTTVHKGGVPTSNIRLNKFEQWDDTNVWAPLQAIIIQGLENTNNPKASFVAFQMARDWIRTTYEGYSTNGSMFEKYDADKIGKSGGGGEYKPVIGFGWTNGFVFEVLDKYGKFLKFNEL